MRRLLMIAVLATAASAALVPPQASAMHDRDAQMDHRRCPRGYHWVPPHRDRRGQWVPGHCAPKRM